MKKSKKPQITPKIEPVGEIKFTETLKWHKWLVFGFGVLIYLNTLSHEYTQDDAIVIYDNIYTKAGITGWADIFTKDTFAGFFKDESKLNLVSGGRYRPFTLAMFALEYQLVGNNPWLGHLINVLLFGFLCFVIYKLLEKLFCYRIDNQANRLLILSISLIFAAHPIHTEAVANVKGRDEIMAMLGAVLALYFLIKYVDYKEVKFLIISLVCFFIGLLSKENTITYLAIGPFTLYFFRDLSLKNAIFKSSYLWISAILFLVIRTAVVGNNFSNPPLELMNNPFIKLVNGEYIPFEFSEKLATIFYTLGKYIQLLLFPITLTHDYYPRYIDIMHFSDIMVIVSVLAYLFLTIIAFKSLKTKSIISFGIIYFLITTTIISNVIFPIGTNMSERFMFMPSLGFAIVLGYFLQNYIFEKFGKNLYFSTLSIIILLFSIKTFSRNEVWESDFKLFTTDVKTSTNSAKVLNAAAGALSTESVKENNLEKKQEMLNEALEYINKAIEIHPTYKAAYFLKGNILNYLKDYEGSILSYETALSFDNQYVDAKNNLAITLREAGKLAGEKENNLVKAEQFLAKSDSLKPNEPETLRLLGVLNGIKGNHQVALIYFKKVLQFEPNNANANLNLGMAYRNTGDAAIAEKYLKKAEQLDASLKRK